MIDIQKIILMSIGVFALTYITFTLTVSVINDIVNSAIEERINND